jgi:hypothetical protein
MNKKVFHKQEGKMMKQVFHAPYALRRLIPGIMFVLFFCACAQPGFSRTQRVGGPCSYKSYPGQATILSISLTEEGAQNEGKQFDVRFTFKPREKVQEAFAQDETKRYLLYGDHFQYPDQDFLTRHHLRVGVVLDGNMQVIVSGTCTPVLFDFPSLKP